jgi:hypothetical protein
MIRTSDIPIVACYSRQASALHAKHLTHESLLTKDYNLATGTNYPPLTASRIVHRDWTLSSTISDIPNVVDPNAESIYGTPTTTTVSIDDRE